MAYLLLFSFLKEHAEVRNLVTGGLIKRLRVARILCDRDVMHSLDFSEVDAEVLLILPDNGRRLRGDQEVPKGSYLVFYS